MGKRIVIALGGNALGNTPYEQLSLVTSPLSSFLSPQATRLSAMTSARTSAKNFFMFFLLIDR